MMLKDWMRGPETKEYEFVLKMCFGSLLPSEEMVRKLDDYGRKRDEDIPLMEPWVRDLDSGQAFGPNTPYYRMIMRLGLEYFKYEEAWV